MAVIITPLRDLLLVRLQPIPETTGRIVRVAHFERCRKADVIAVGPEVRDVRIGMVALVNPLIGTVVQDQLLLPESTILGYEE